MHSATPPTEPIHVNEAQARRIVLVQALDAADPHGKLVGAAEREQADREALAATGDPARGEALDARAWVLERASRLAGLLEHRQPRLAALQRPPHWMAWLAWGLPMLALVAGGLIERIDNPKQVNLLSPPLLAFLLWNLAVYLFIAVAAFWPPRAAAGPGRWARHLEALAERPRGGVAQQVANRFRLQWWRVAGALEGQRWRRILHTSAAAWAVGVAASIALGGLVREYRIGWESTLLELPQVHAFLQFLFAPVVAVTGMEPFSLDELARLHFGSGEGVGRAEARRWVFLYMGLLGLLVVLPRALLALWAALRQRWLAGSIALDLGDAYFTPLLGRVRPARVLLAIGRAAADGADPLQTILRQASGGVLPARPGEPFTLFTSARGDSLQCVVLPVGQAAPMAVRAEPPAGRWPAWLPLGRRPQAPLAVAGATDTLRADVLLLACSSQDPPDAWSGLLQQGAWPALLLAGAGCESACAALLRRAPAGGETLPLAALPTWREDSRLRAAIERLLPPYKAAGAQRLWSVWEERAHARHVESMRLLAAEVAQAARDSAELNTRPTGMRQLVVREEREAGQAARRQAMAALLGRVRERQAGGDARLRALHGVEGGGGSPLEAHDLPERFRIEQSVHEPQAGLAGAASGAAMGAAVDLMTGGLTLGAASALGALVGGGAALVAAAWKNRGSQTPGGSSVALSDEMLQALVAAVLLRYLDAAHRGRALAEPDLWRTRAEAAVTGELAALQALWPRLRTEAAEGDAVASLANLLERLSLRVLGELGGG
ncbi:DUF3482 domain-containing protein [Ramlibacter tataouinensis]|uniref:DUF3482 domain-containing protein n=1 Tax=Ramlibacter tataouinensis TaxID=94132 RepID=UPI0022F4010D|nr:DUF3482 domain-containing protein [Ramlibacter tataouinensis]WBY01897.1 DUF3482 domain-containing protein [Ramlibacter tataouinensis]